MSQDIYLGIDFGTSGARAIAIDAQQQIQAQTNVSFGDQTADCNTWRITLLHLIQQIPQALRQQMRAIAIDGTSSTVLICDEQGQPLNHPLLYSDDRGAAVLDTVRTIAPANHTVISSTSSLAKLLWWAEQGGWGETRRHGDTGAGRDEGDEGDVGTRGHGGVESANSSSPTIHRQLPITPFQPLTPNPPFPTPDTRHPTPYFLHQADWLSFLLHGQLGVSDYHNALKLGYDVEHLRYPDWLQKLPIPFRLPEVVTPGEAIAPVLPDIANQLGLPDSCLVCAGTTDSIAAFLASGAQSPGEAVTSLGSTLVLKLLSATRVEDARHGIYSHRLGNLWLVGGASNTGGAVLRQFFSDTDLERLSNQISPKQESQLDYYPLLQPGERFPINDPTLPPRLTPRPNRDVDFLHGLLEGIARIEAEGYRLLQVLGASSLTRVYTAGGGARNTVWMQVRSRHLQLPVLRSAQTEAAYGTALLAMRGANQF